MIEKDNIEQIKKLNDEEQMTLVVQLISLYINLENIFEQGIDYRTQMKLKEFMIINNIVCLK